MTDPTPPPTYVPQPYPLWCAELHPSGVLIAAGNVVAWEPHPDGGLLPVVVRQTYGGMTGPVTATPVGDGTRWFLADSAEEVLRLAERAADAERQIRAFELFAEAEETRRTASDFLTSHAASIANQDGDSR